MFSPGTDKPQYKQKDLLRVFKTLFNNFASEHNITTEELTNINMKDFAVWAIEQYQQRSNHNSTIFFLEQSGVPADLLSFVFDILSNPYHTAIAMQNMWPLLVYNSRPMAVIAPVGITVTVQIKYADGTVFTSDAVVAPDHEEPMTDGMLLAQLLHGAHLTSLPIKNWGQQKMYNVAKTKLRYQQEQANNDAGHSNTTKDNADFGF